jgi:glycosyltransferase involved in cell wall biosynthesis
VAGGVAILVDPVDVSDMAEKLIALLDDKTSVQSSRQLARERSRQFSWRISATQIRDALLDAAHPQWLRS